ncbi:MAG: BBP7 family outer membrane beta-barrel protein [Pirellulaceae bacterium]
MPWEREANLEVWAPADTCGWWAETDFLLWWSEGADVPPLVTSSPAGTAANVAGVLGQPGTTVLLGGDETLATGSQAGGNVTLGWWYNPCGSALQFSYLVLSEQDSQFNADSTQIPILARPVVLNQVPAAMLVAHPDFLAGSLAVAGRTELQAMEALWRHRWYEHPMGHQLDFFLGYRYANLDESLHFDQFSRWTAPQGNIIVGTTKQLFDDFQAENEFHGANVGFAFQRTFPRWTFNVQLKVGLGNNHSSVRIDGATVTTVPNAGAATFVGGLLAQRTNIGRYSENNFAVLPELRVGIVRRLSDRVQWSAGYNALFWSNVARPGDQIDINVSQFPPEPIAPAALPAFRFGTSSYWAHGLHAGIEVSF